MTWTLFYKIVNLFIRAGAMQPCTLALLHWEASFWYMSFWGNIEVATSLLYVESPQTAPLHRVKIYACVKEAILFF